MCQLQGFQSCGSCPGDWAPAARAYASLSIPAYVLSGLCTGCIIKQALVLLPASTTAVAELDIPCVLQVSEDISIKNVTKETALQRLHLINWDASWPHSSPVLAEALPYGCWWPSNAGAAAGGALLRLLKVSSTWGLLDRPNQDEPGDHSSASFPSPAVTQAPLLQIPSLHSFTAFLSSIIILCNWPCQKSPYITTATPGTCLETHACLRSLSIAIFCTWMDSTLLQEILKIKKTHLQASGTHWAWHNSFSCLSQTTSVHYNIERPGNNRCQWENNNLLYS